MGGARKLRLLIWGVDSRFVGSVSEMDSVVCES